MVTEQEFQESEETRKKTLEKVELAKLGQPLPGSDRDTLQKVEELKRVFSSIGLEGRAYERVCSVLDVIKMRTETVEELKTFGLEINSLVTALNMVSTQLQGIWNVSKQHDARFSAFLDKVEKQMQLRTDTLTKLNKYLDNWL